MALTRYWKKHAARIYPNDALAEEVKKNLIRNSRTQEERGSSKYELRSSLVRCHEASRDTAGRP
jgi:hypothetical protein